MFQGKIIEWNDSKGYGFISAFDGKLKAFVHISAVNKANRRPKVNDEVKFEITEDDQGRFNALNVTLLEVSSTAPTVILAISFLVFVIIVGTGFHGEILWIPIYLLMSFITYGAYAIDKDAAQKNKWRTSEKTLHILSLLGGWPGALYAQKQLRHKSQKQPFKTILWFTIIVNMSMYIWTLTPEGAAKLENVINLFV